MASVEPTAAEQCVEERKLNHRPGCFTQQRLTHHKEEETEFTVDVGEYQHWAVQLKLIQRHE